MLETFLVTHTLLAFDYDGTLAPISKTPSLANLNEDSEFHLNKISKKAPVAIITGRSVEDVTKLLPFTPKYVIGNHGIEGSHSKDELEEFATLMQNHKKLILDQHQNTFSSMGILVEDKTYSLTLHYRNSKDPKLAEHFLMSLLNDLPQAHVTKGKKVINIVPRNGAKKGSALMQLLAKENTKLGIYIGDDVTDEDVFIYKNPNLLTIKVGFSKISHADYYLKNQKEVVKVLEILSKSLA